MKKFLIAAAAVLLLGTATSCGKKAAKDVDPATVALADSISTALGESQAAQLLAEYNSLPDSLKAKINKENILKGLQTVLNTDTADRDFLIGLQVGMQMIQQTGGLTQEGVPVDNKKVYEAFAENFRKDSVPEVKDVIARYQGLMSKAQKVIMEKRDKAAREQAKKNSEAGAQYINDLRKKDAAVKVTSTGLAYKVLKAGNGPLPTKGQSVKVNYTGKKINGKVFDSSIERGEPAVFPVDQVVPGFSEGLQLMPVGSKYMLYIPGSLAYGITGQPMAGIEPNETLIFEVELLGIENPEQAAEEALPAQN